MKLYRNIVVPLDGSELGERALLMAVQIAGAMSRLSTAEDKTSDPVKLTLLRSTTGPSLATSDPFVYDTMLTVALDEAGDYLTAVADNLDSAGIVIETKTVPGPAAEAIVQYAEEDAADLIVISSHGRTGGIRWVYGSVAEKVLHHAPCAVVIIRAQAPSVTFEEGAILVPLDGSELAEKALSPALMLAESVGCNVVLLRVVPSPEPVAEGLVNRGAPSAEQLRMVEQQARAEALEYLQRVYAGLPTEHLSCDVTVSVGNVPDTIVDYASSHGVDMIVMTSHGRSGLSRWLHGSVAEKVLRGAECATLIVRSTVSPR